MSRVRREDYTDDVQANVDFLGSRARDLVDAEIERTRGLDTKAGGLLAASLALLVAGMAFSTRLPDIAGGDGAKRLWAVTLGAGLLLVLTAIAFAVAALVPRASRSEVHRDELERWPTPRVLQKPPTQARGELMMGDILAIAHSREANDTKAHRLTWAFLIFSAALACIVASTFSVAIHAAR